MLHPQFAVKGIFGGSVTDNAAVNIPGQAGFRIVIVELKGRMNGGTATKIRINATDSFHSSIGNQLLSPLAAGGLVNISVPDLPHTFGEGRTVGCSVTSAIDGGAATSTDIQAHYYYEPIPVGTDL